MEQEKSKKLAEYSVKLINAISEVFNEESDNFISEDDLDQGENLNLFFHCLMNVMPKHLYEEITSQKTDIIGIGHIANRLAIQNITKIES